MAVKGKNTNKVPNLRFPRFDDNWVKKSIGDVATKINSGKTPLGGEATYKNEGILFIRSQNVNNNKLEMNGSVFISEEINNTMKNSIVNPNDILLNITGASLGRSCVVPNDFIIGNVNQHVCIIRLMENYDPRFLQPLLASTKGQNIFQSLQTGSGREGLNFESIRKIQLFFPSNDEQKRIASFLEAIDERISTQNKIIKELESLTKSIGQTIFQGDKYQFGNAALGSICTIKKGEQVNTTELSESGLYPVMNGGISPSGYYSQFNCEGNTISISEGGNSCGYVQYNYGKFWSGGHCYTLSKIDPSVSNKYLYYFMKFSESSIMSLRVGSGLPNIQKKDLEKFKINFPEINQQQEISSILDHLTEKLENEKLLRSEWIKLREYLLRNMFI